MAYVAPDYTAFVDRFPEFASRSETTVEMILDEAIAEVGDSWIERDRAPAVLYLTAHLLASQGAGVSSPGGGGAAVTGAIKRRKVGDVETEFAGVGVAGTGALGHYSTTMYGRRYLELMRRNFPAVRVI